MRPDNALWAALLAVCMVPATGSAAELRPLGTYVWSEDRPTFGGFSGLVMDEGGASFLTVSDHGTLVSARVQRDAEGRIIAVATEREARLLDNFGKAVSDFTGDAEAIARAPDGTLYIAYESYARVTGLRLPDLQPIKLHDWKRFKALWGNEGFESLALLPGGGLLLVLEHPQDDGAYRTLVGRDGAFADGPTIPDAGVYQASDAAFDAAGRLYLLERRVNLVGRFATRIRRFAFDGAAFAGGEVLLETQPGGLDNMEGLSLWRDADGRQRVTLISDDNFRSFQSTEIAEYELIE